eukprot:NODE_978_length_1781_cov_25.537529_g863_i0.p1 GENE.NODE_978_length_1781_cov_25.537529_g863_i0~~NODE_978_length_1781_cov_25.537529_g863_i0.p1  ORF type:complete len:364 (-),score=58.05 NODE_978_length_1781_cov_25.537529_g863_i0:329-1420(-)
MGSAQWIPGTAPSGPAGLAAKAKDSQPVVAQPLYPALATRQPSLPSASASGSSLRQEDIKTDHLGNLTFIPDHPDPAPHLNAGCTDEPPGPRMNAHPPPPPQTPPTGDEPLVPPPQEPRLMTFQPPKLRSGMEYSPPEGELVTKHVFNTVSQEWTKTQQRVRIDKYPFQEGTMRSVFYMKDLARPMGGQQDWVAKISKDPSEDSDAYFHECEMQAIVQSFAEEYNKRDPPKKVVFADIAVIQCMERESTDGRPVLFTIEPYIAGPFIKYTNNYGWINPLAPRHTPQAFSHFSYELTEGKLIVVDVQGVIVKNVDCYTDPQIHSDSSLPAFGKGDLKEEGIAKFFETHCCNDVCRRLGLQHPLT